MRVQPPITHLPLRYANTDLDLAGVRIAKGDPIMICLAAVGRDGAVNGPAATEFDPGRDGGEHLSFGHGPHFCLGAPLARMQARIALPALFDTFPRLRLAVPAEDLVPQQTFIMNGPEHLPVRLR
jgi:cytochrome P450